MTVYEVITRRIVELLEQGTIPWRKPWVNGESRNLVSGKPYRGINTLILGASRYSSPFWLTFKQALAAGGCVRTGERGAPVVFWKRPEEEEGEATESGRGFILRYYTAFNVEQCDGVKAPEAARVAFEPIPECARIVAAMPKAPRIDHGGSQAFYMPSADRVQVPAPEAFTSAAAYYSTLFHELTHSTGHASRLARKGISDGALAFGSHDYSREELVAEMGAAFLCGVAGIEAETLQESSAYLGNWIKALKGDSRLAVTAAAQAQKAADFVLGRVAASAEAEREPAAAAA